MNTLPIHQNIYNKLDYFTQSNNIPHIIFHGKTGSGKRTIVNNFLNKIYHNDKQKEIAEIVISGLSKHYENPIVTELSEAVPFYEAEKEHQEFYKNNPEFGYCGFVIDPKLAKLRKLHSDKLKK